MSTLAIAILCVVGFAAIVALCVAGMAALYEEWQRPDDAIDPYQVGLDASARIASAAFETERLMHVAAENAKQEERGDH
jgi:hypothetical protein